MIKTAIDPICCRIPTINLTLSAAVLTTGGLVTKFLQLLNSVNMVTHTETGPTFLGEYQYELFAHRVASTMTFILFMLILWIFYAAKNILQICEIIFLAPG